MEQLWYLHSLCVIVYITLFGIITCTVIFTHRIISNVTFQGYTLYYNDKCHPYFINWVTILSLPLLRYLYVSVAS